MKSKSKYKGITEIYIEDVNGIDIPVIIKSYSVSDSNSDGWQQYVITSLMDFISSTGEIIKDKLLFRREESDLFEVFTPSGEFMSLLKYDIEYLIQRSKSILEYTIYPKPSKGIRLNILKGKIRSYISLNKMWVCFNDIGYEIRRLSKYRPKDFEGVNGSCYKDLFGFRIVKRKFFNSKYSKEYWYE